MMNCPKMIVLQWCGPQLAKKLAGVLGVFSYVFFNALALNHSMVFRNKGTIQGRFMIS